MSFRVGAWAAALAILVSGASQRANAAVADLEAMQQANANLAFQYGFEGADDSTRLADGSGNGFGLQRTAAGTGDPGDVQFVPGWGGVGQAYQPSFDTSAYNSGAGLNTISTAVPVGAAVTVELVVQLDSFVQPTGSTTGAYLLSARPQPGNGRAYFFRQMNDTSVRVTTTLGNTFGDVPPVLDYTTDDWYYLVLTAEYDSGADQTTANWYAADLSAGETTLTLLATDNTTFQGLFDGDSQIGVGNFVNGTQEFMQGRMDSVALTNEVLSANELQGRLDALNRVPEPATCGLLALAGGLALAIRRRR